MLNQKLRLKLSQKLSPQQIQLMKLIQLSTLEFEQKLKRYNPELIFFYYNYFSKGIENLKNKKLIAFAGIGNPTNFFDFLKEKHLILV